MTGYAEQDGTFVTEKRTLQRINGKLRPLGARKTPTELATLTASILGASDSWKLRSWYSIFSSLQEHTCLLENIDPYSIDSEGILLEPELGNEDVQNRAA